MFNLKLLFAGIFAASICFGQGSNTETITDADGNVYHTVKFGHQVWMVDNLRTTRYNDGTSITLETSEETWGTGADGKYCYYGNATEEDLIKDHGALYNWYAVDTKKLAPEGWHVPTDAEWEILKNYFASDDGHEHIQNFYPALPSGSRGRHGDFGGFIAQSDWWSASEYGEGSLARETSLDGKDLTRIAFYKNCGLSVRLLRDELDYSNSSDVIKKSAAGLNGSTASIVRTAGISDYWMECTGDAKGYFYSVWASGSGDVFVAGNKGLIRSSNRGKSWRVVLPEQTFFVMGTSYKDLYAGGSALYHSVDGNRWEKQLDVNSSIESIVSLSPGKIMAVSQNGDVFITTDRGRHWLSSHLPIINGNPAVLRVLATAGIVFVSGEKGVLLRSEDDGKTWNQVSFPGNNSIVGLWSPPGQTNIVYAAFNSPEDKGCLAQSSDGGAAWSLWLTFPVESRYGNGSIWGTSSSDFYVMFLGDLLHTRDAGVTWENATVNEAYHLDINAAGNDAYLLGLNVIRRLR
jgi:uncharacterized protein (TIGR02145 family)